LRKIVITFIVGIILSGCSVTRNRVNTENVKILKGNILEITENQNITNHGFFIQKAEIEILTPDGKEKFIATIKFEGRDKYLISIKSRTGIEGARIYITKDTILINDRINKKLYYGTAEYLRLKYGVAENLLPLIFGDLLLEEKCKNNSIKCVDDKIKVNCLVKGIYINYIIDCKTGKTSMVSFGEQGISLNYDKYFLLDSILVPRNIEFNSTMFNTLIKIKIVKVEAPWDGSVSFISGKGYELIELR
jgi:hypothetical protein